MLIYWTSLSAGALTVLLVHELGHLLAARWSSVRVLSISVGLGPELIGFSDRFGTRWRIGPLPIGGYVAMQDKRVADDEIDDLSSRPFGEASIHEKVAIYLAGPAFSLLLGVGLLGIIFISTGYALSPNTLTSQSNVTIPALVAALSIGLGAFNLLPFPPLDGGRLLLLGIEALWATPVPDRVHTTISRAGLVLIVLSTLLFTYLLFFN